ncbi:hypothetical protein FE392_03680 [Xenorhabdus sp. 12]|uniref:Uncharacterized protein n=1 Tax=Xenorhabdus santafensis TaxID=2582833 RepID=A0ABU4S7F8_9GAMM|nr:hypothetical protein [Xenorhabdus sp. 12]MDX7986435.1 hypothetical protein [Xenorhabdus sp. 12]
MKFNKLNELELQRKYWDIYRENVRSRWNKQAVDTMMNEGKAWHREGNRNLHDDIKRNIDDLQREIQAHPYSPEEEQFANAFMGKKFFIVHASSNDLNDNSKRELLICSHRYLEKKGTGFFKNNTTIDDVRELANDDYVFFSLEVGGELQKKRSRFGNKFYRIPYTKENVSLRHSSMALVDQILLTAPDSRMIKGLTNGANVHLDHRRFINHRIIFSGIDNCLTGLLYSIILTVRKFNITLQRDRETILYARSDKEISDVINGLFRPEIRVPRMFSASVGEYKKILKK